MKNEEGMVWIHNQICLLLKTIPVLRYFVQKSHSMSTFLNLSNFFRLSIHNRSLTSHLRRVYHVKFEIIERVWGRIPLIRQQQYISYRSIYIKTVYVSKDTNSQYTCDFFKNYLPVYSNFSLYLKITTLALKTATDFESLIPCEEWMDKIKSWASKWDRQWIISHFLKDEQELRVKSLIWQHLTRLWDRSNRAELRHWAITHFLWSIALIVEFKSIS